jgi:methyl-accepting chemotaxis protein
MEQSAGVGQFWTPIMAVGGSLLHADSQQITDVVQQTSMGAHESATAAAQLKGNAEEMEHLVRQFIL